MSRHLGPQARSARNGVAGLALALLLWAAPAAAQSENLPPDVRSAIAAMGPVLSADMFAKSFAAMRPLQAPRTGLDVARDVSYGDAPLQKLDLWRSKGDGAVPIVLFVHSGGFTRGDKADYDNVPAYFARHGALGVNMNYRLAPNVAFPAETLDVGSAVQWLAANAARYGGDPTRILLIGHSAGAAIVASYVLDRTIETSRAGVVGAVLISGGYVPHEQDVAYYGARMAELVPMAHLDGKLPLLIAMTEYDPPLLASDSHVLAAALCKRDGICPPFLWLSGHNHMSEIASLDTGDDRLGSEIRGFLQRVAR
jgi:triacylglycerol lipase